MGWRPGLTGWLDWSSRSQVDCCSWPASHSLDVPQLICSKCIYPAKQAQERMDSGNSHQLVVLWQPNYPCLSRTSTLLEGDYYDRYATHKYSPPYPSPVHDICLASASLNHEGGDQCEYRGWPHKGAMGCVGRTRTQ